MEVSMACNISSVQPSTFQYMPYATMLYNDFDNIDMASGSTYPGIMGPSIFGCGGFGMPMAGCGGMNNTSYFDSMRQYQKYYNDLNIEQQKMQRNADLQLNGSMEAIQTSAAALKDKIVRNEQDQIMKAYQKYVDCVRHAYGDSTEADIGSRAAMLYQQITGKTLIQDIRENAHGSMTQGILNSMSFGTYYRHSAEDNISQITGQEVAQGEKDSQNAGRVLGGVGLGGALAGGLYKLTGKGKYAWIGAGIGAVATLMSFITGKVRT